MEETGWLCHELFSQQLSHKAVDFVKANLEFLCCVVGGQEEAIKSGLASFEKSVEETCLVATGMQNGDQLRISMEAILAFVKLTRSRQQESKYAFIKDALQSEASGDHLTKAVEYLEKFVDFNTSDPKGGPVDVTAVAALAGKLVEEGKEWKENIVQEFTTKLDESMVSDVVVPPEVESMTEMDQIKSDWVEQAFPMDRSVQVSETTVQMSTRLRDLKVAMSYLGTFLDPTPYEINHRTCLLYLCLDSFKRTETGTFNLRR